MKALSLSQPWLWAVLYCGKHVENRSWMPPIAMIGERIALHAAKSWDDRPDYRAPNGNLVRPFSFIEDCGFHPPARFDLYDKSALVGVATIDKIVTEDRTLADDQRRWFFGPYGWLLTDVRILTAIPCKGKQGLWTVPDELERQVVEQLARAA